MATKLEMDHVEPQAKAFDKGWEGEQWHIDTDASTNKTSVSGFGIERFNDGRLTMTVGFDSQFSSGDRAALVENVRQLMDGNLDPDSDNAINYEVESSAHERMFSLKITGATPGDLARVAGALSSSVDLGQGATSYGLIDKSIAIQVADLETEALGETEAFSVNRVPFENQGQDYLDYESNIPGSAVTMLQQDGQSAALAGISVTAEKTRIIFNPADKSDIVRALRSTNLDFNAGNAVIEVNEPIHEVADTLKKSGLLPEDANAQIAKEFAEVRTEFTRVSEVEDDAPRAHAVLAAKAAIKPVGA